MFDFPCLVACVSDFSCLVIQFKVQFVQVESNDVKITWMGLAVNTHL